ncbi:MAG: acetyl-CoA acetyltransferase [Candidatus Hydrogenedentota bacterium]
MRTEPVFILGGYQTDYAEHYTRHGKDLVDLFKDTVSGTLETADVAPGDIEVAHVGNFIGEHMCYQAHLNAFFLEVDETFYGLPTARHEAACASGSIAVLSAMADIEAGRYACTCAMGVEMERNKPSKETASHLGLAAWYEQECTGVAYPWPHLFSRLAEEYHQRYGLERAHLTHLAENAYNNARTNPNAQTRVWEFDANSFGEDDQANPVIDGWVRRRDCSQVTDGGAGVILASQQFAAEWAAKRGIALEQVPRIKGWGHKTARIRFDDKMEHAKDSPYVFPHVRETIQDAFRRAEMPGVEAVDFVETHDCFSPTAYMAIDHFGYTPPGENARAIDSGAVDRGGACPLNPSGGLIGVGHPVGASGVRMLLDCTKQVTGQAAGYQVENARNGALLNIGGSATTCVSFVVGL